MVIDIIYLWYAKITEETYAPMLLRRCGQKLSKLTRNIYISNFDVDQGKPIIRDAFNIALPCPWILLFREPIVFLLHCPTVFMSLRVLRMRPGNISNLETNVGSS